MTRSRCIRFNAVVRGPVGDGLTGGWDVELSNGHRLLAHLPSVKDETGRKKPQIPEKDFLPGESLVVVCSPFDLSRGQIELSSEKAAKRHQ